MNPDPELIERVARAMADADGRYEWHEYENATRAVINAVLTDPAVSAGLRMAADILDQPNSKSTAEEAVEHGLIAGTNWILPPTPLGRRLLEIVK